MLNATRHAPHGACELKSCCAGVTPEKHSHAPHGACELKLKEWITEGIEDESHAPHGACELKFRQRPLYPRLLAVTLPTERVS